MCFTHVDDVEEAAVRPFIPHKPTVHEQQGSTEICYKVLDMATETYVWVKLGHRLLMNQYTLDID
jgi:hypothetical protein